MYPTNVPSIQRSEVMAEIDGHERSFGRERSRNEQWRTSDWDSVYDQQAREISLRRRQANAKEFAAKVWPRIRALLQRGVGWKTIAKTLNRNNVSARRGGSWQAIQVRRVAAQFGWFSPNNTNPNKS